jgi:hypothetical protein
MLDLPAAAQSSPTASSARPGRLCAECGVEFKPTRNHQSFCSDAHKKTFHNRAAVEGRAIIALAKAWRASRNAKGNSPEALAIREVGNKALSEMVSIVDGFMAEDKDAGRPSPIPYVRRLLANGGRYMDRQRRR